MRAASGCKLSGMIASGRECGRADDVRVPPATCQVLPEQASKVR